MFESLFMERKLSDKVEFVKDLMLDTESGETILIEKGAKGDKVKEYVGRFETDVEVKLDKPIRTHNSLVSVIRVKKDFRVINNAS